MATLTRNKAKAQVNTARKAVRDWTKPLQPGELPPTQQECIDHIKECEASGFISSEEFNYKLDKWLHKK